jgi:hypothetical protein
MNIKSVRAFSELIPLKKPYTIARETISDAGYAVGELLILIPK